MRDQIGAIVHRYMYCNTPLVLPLHSLTDNPLKFNKIYGENQKSSDFTYKRVSSRFHLSFTTKSPAAGATIRAI